MSKKDSKILDPLPEGIGVAMHHEDGSITYIADPFLVGMKWEGVRVDSLKFKQLSTHERLYRLSREYLRAAIILCEKAGEAGTALTWPQASVVYYNLHLATELFLKASLLSAGKPPKTLNHEVADLFKEYATCFRDNEFYFSTPWQISAGDIDEALGRNVLSGVDRVPDQLFRYGMNKSGQTSKGMQQFAPGYMFNYLTDLESKWSRIWELLKERVDS